MSTSKTDTQPYRILAGIGDADQLTLLLAIAVPLARARSGKVIPLYVAPTEELPEWLVIPPDIQDVVEHPHHVRSPDVGRAILNTVREIEPDLLLLHWKGRTSRGRYLLGRTLDPVIKYAPCDVAVLRTAESPAAFAERMADVDRVLVPMGGGPNASLALDLGLDLDEGARVTGLRVANRNLGPTAISAQWSILTGALERWEHEDRLQPHVTLAANVSEGILKQAAQDYDLMLIGATRESLVDRLLFGNLPQELADRSPIPVIIMRRHEQTPAAALRRARWRILHVMPQLTLDERISIYRQVRRGARPTQDFYVMMTLSAAIASLGLLLNSSAVIIGAMLVAPLMSALLGTSLGIVQGDFWLLRLGLRTALLGALLSVLVSAFVALLVPERSLTPEITSRGSPTLLDLGIALVSGAAAAYAVSRRDVASALPGVAIAVALVPPLSTLGVAAVQGDRGIALGALLLFCTNLAAIISAAAVMFLWMGFHPNVGERSRARTFRGGIVGTALLLAAVTVILGLLTVASFRRSVVRSTIDGVLTRQIQAMGAEVQIEDWRITSLTPEEIAIEVSVESSRTVSQTEFVAAQQEIASELDRSVSLALTVIPVTRLEPLPIPTAGTPPADTADAD